MSNPPGTTSGLIDGIRARGIDDQIPNDWIIDEAVIVARLFRPDGTPRIIMLTTEGADLILTVGLLAAADAIAKDHVIDSCAHTEQTIDGDD